MAARPRLDDGSYLPTVSDSVPTILPPSLHTPHRKRSQESLGSEVPLIEQMRRSPSRNTLESRSMMGSLFTTNHFNSFIINDLTNYSMNDQRWTLQRKKIGLKRRTKGVSEKKSRDLKTRDITLNFVKQFKKKECTKFVEFKSRYESAAPTCHCGLKKSEHLTFVSVPAQQPGQGGDTNINLDPHQPVDVAAGDLPYLTGCRAPATPHPEPIAEEEDQDFDEKILMPAVEENETRGAGTPRGLLGAEGIVSRRQRDMRIGMVASPASSYLVPDVREPQPPKVACFGNFVTPRSKPEDASGATLVLPKELLKDLDGEEDGDNKAWNMGECITEFPTDAYGLIDFVNETSGSSKPSKYVRLSNGTSMSKVLALLTDYWRLTEPKRPNLVLSVTGGAKNFKLDGNKKAVFTTGLIKAVRSTNAWLLTGGMHVGVMRSVGEAVNEGQHITKVTRKNLFAQQESVHLVRGIKCLGVAPFGYIKDYKSLVNPDPSVFSKIKYKIDEKVEKKANISLNGDHTHFILVDNGIRHSFSGADRFRTRLEEAIQAPEPTGLGIPVVLLLLEGGMSSIVKCSMALKGRIPVVVVAGTGRAADILAYGVSMTHETPSGKLVMRKVHQQQLHMRVEATMGLYDKKKQKVCSDLVVQCCQRADLITIFDINSGEPMDKYILFALLKGDGLHSESSRLDQLHLSLLWNRPDIAESHIFPALPYWPTGSLEDLMTMALLEEKVEFVKLFAVNGLVTNEYLTVSNLRHLYNASCDPNTHLAKLLQRTTRSKTFHLKHVHKLLLALLGHHNDQAYLADTPDAAMEISAINYYTFEDPYLELFLWSVLSGRGLLARYLWERCNSPLTSAVVGSALYRALWKSLGAKNTELRNRYFDLSSQFEKLAVRLMEDCYAEDPVNAMGLVERRSVKWGNLDVLDLAFNGTEMNFIASSCCQASVDLSWRRGMVRCSTLPSLLTIFMPFLVWTKLFSFQKLGDNGGELTKFQKLIVFYKSPMTKFYSHSLAFVLFLTLHAYVVLFDFRYQMALSEKLLLFWVVTFAVEEISELSLQQPTTFYAKLMTWYDSVWNRFDIVAFIFASVAFGLRMNRSTFTYGRIAYAFNTAVFFCRVLRIYHVHYRLGPKLVIFYRMLSEVLMFMALLIVFILGYGLSAQSLLRPSPSRTLDSDSIINTIKDVILIPYWQMYGELLLENMEGQDEEVCHFVGVNETMFCENPKDYTWAVQIMLIFYLIIGNIMLLNLLIAIFTYVFDEVHENSMEIWKYERFRLIREYDSKPGLVPPIVVLEHAYRFSKWFWKAFLRKKKENLEDYMTSTLLTLRIFEKEAVSSFLAKLQQSQEASLDQRVCRISEKIDLIAKYVEQEQELRNIEEDLEWATQQLELDEDLIEAHHIDDVGSESDNEGKSNRKKSQWKNKAEKDEIDTNDAGKGLSDSDEKDGTLRKPVPIEAAAFNAQAHRKISVNRKISVGKNKNSSLSLDSNLHSILKHKRDPVAQITNQTKSAGRRLAISSLPYESSVDHAEEDVLEEELSEEDMERKMDHLRHQLHSAARALSPSSASMKMPPAKQKGPPQLGGGWDGELHYPSRPTSAALLRQSSGRPGLSAGRKAIGSARHVMNQVDALNYRIEALSANVEKFQKNFERLVNSLGHSKTEVESFCNTQSSEDAENLKVELEVNFAEPLYAPDDGKTAEQRKSAVKKSNPKRK